MFNQLSLTSRICLLVGAVLLNAIVTVVLNLSLWIESQSDIDQRNDALLISKQISRLIEANLGPGGELPARSKVQEIVHLRWVRDVDILRISVVALDDTIVADTEAHNVGKPAPSDWSLADRPQRLRLTTDALGQRTYLIPVVAAQHGLVCALFIQLNVAAYRSDLYLAYEPLLRMGIPLIAVALACVIGAGLLASRHIVAASLQSLVGPDARQPAIKRAVLERRSSLEEQLETPEIRQTRQRLEAAASRLQDLASR
jgi:hypothetical protein